MRTLGALLVIVAIVMAIFIVGLSIYADYQYENEVYSYWNLADKSSTIQAKSDYMTRFVSALNDSNLADNDALIYKTADNNCRNNVDAVITLSNRLDEIKGMDVSSFEYQQALQQITGQEQGEAQEMLHTLSGCWMKTNWYYLWNPVIGFVSAFFTVIMFMFGIKLIMDGE